MTVRTNSRVLSFILAFTMLTSVVAAASNLNSKSKPVNDLAEVLTDAEERRIIGTVERGQAAADGCVLVQIVKRTFNDSIESYAKKLATRLNAGSQCKEKYLVVALAIEDKKIRVEFGKQLQLTDRKVKSAIDVLMTPEFAKGNFEKGLQAGLKDLLGDGHVARDKKASPAQDGWYLSNQTGVLLMNGEPDFECVPAETTPLKIIDELNQGGVRFTKSDTFDESNQRVTMTMINVIDLNKTLIFWRSKVGCERVAKARREASEAMRRKYE